MKSLFWLFILTMVVACDLDEQQKSVPSTQPHKINYTVKVLTGRNEFARYQTNDYKNTRDLLWFTDSDTGKLVVITVASTIIIEEN
jgi:hypothetical protein